VEHGVELARADADEAEHFRATDHRITHTG